MLSTHDKRLLNFILEQQLWALQDTISLVQRTGSLPSLDLTGILQIVKTWNDSVRNTRAKERT